MKKKLAVCANGWSMDALYKAIKGFRKYAEKEDFDIFVFLSFASYSVYQSLMQGELNVYDLCDPADYDGVVVFSNMLNSDSTAIAICNDARKKGVPVVSVGMDIEGVPSVCVGNAMGIREVVTHLIEDHGAEKICYIGGTEDHPDSRERLEVTRKVMAEHGLKLSDDDVAYGKWSNRRTIEALDELLGKRDGLPDAIVCANDIMALAACTELEKRGIRVPKDVIVTGFDNIEHGTIFYPALTTVQQNYDMIAIKACDILFGRDDSDKIIVPTTSVIAESCGCRSRKYAKYRRLYCKHSFQRSNDENLLEQNERGMRNWISMVSDYRDMKVNLRRHYFENHQYEGSAFYLVLINDYFEDVTSSGVEICKRGLKGTLDVAVGLKDGKLVDIKHVEGKDLIPGYEKKDGEQHIYFISGLHHYDQNYGYVVFADEPYILNESMMYPYLEKLMQALRFLRTNLRLKLLYDKDPLTGLYNRLGYEEKALPLYQDSLKSKSGLSVMFIDINSMKYINDHFGHEQGDTAIKTVATSINDLLEDEWVAVRFGGDEFLVIVPECDEEQADQIKKKIIKHLAEKREEAGLPYDLTVSIGFVTTDPVNRSDASLKEYVREADTLMYEIKKKMHAKG